MTPLDLGQKKKKVVHQVETRRCITSLRDETAEASVKKMALSWMATSVCVEGKRYDPDALTQD